MSGSQSTLQALNSNTSNSPRELTTLIVIIHQMISKLNINITLQWIPGHIGIMGNEKAVKLSKAGSSMEQPDRPVSYLTLRSMLINNHKEEWLNQWASGNTGRAMYKEMTMPNKLDSINFLSRKEQSTIFQLRTGHTPLLNYHLNNINSTQLPLCRHCAHPYETVNRILSECPFLIHLSRPYFHYSPT
ncbi:uncharacterized protein LOC129925184 [Biomphalaria glabrata]|uniref:Uncharacterized protein LOC129925184 n=1 Tax=Biomphalaria glabrata TaxID=6526 RepID=A0A9W2ZYL7_BIOGL|nr:uncharacterized protein LOC129925184 [Biomphalaria glabrata]